MMRHCLGNPRKVAVAWSAAVATCKAHNGAVDMEATLAVVCGYRCGGFLGRSPAVGLLEARARPRPCG